MKTSKPASAAFEMPKFEMPKFDMPKVEMPAAFREFAERGVAQAKDTYEKMKAAAEEATDVLETTYSTATKGASDYGLKVIEAARTNTNAAFDFAGELMAAKTLSEVVELSSAHARKQFETLTAAGQGTRRAGAEGRDRDRRADQERHEQGVQQGQPDCSLSRSRHYWRWKARAPARAFAFVDRQGAKSSPHLGRAPRNLAKTAWYS